MENSIWRIGKVESSLASGCGTKYWDPKREKKKYEKTDSVATYKYIITNVLLFIWQNSVIKNQYV